MSTTPTRIAQRAVTQRDIAARCGISQMAVSLALRNDPRVSAATIAQVHAVAAELGYDPASHQAARRMVLKRHGQDVLNHIIALFVPSYYHRMPYYMSLMQGLLDELMEQRFGLLTLYMPEEGMINEYQLPPAFAAGNIDAVAMIGFTTHMEMLRTQLRAKVGFGHRPVVAMMSAIPEGTAVLTNDASGFTAATEHLLNLGHRHIIHIGAFWGNVAREHLRSACIREALQAHGLDPETHHHQFSLLNPNWLSPLPLSMTERRQSVFKTKEGEVTLADYLRRHPEVTAILAANDPCALHASYVLKEMGLRVPEDISLVGFDDVEPVTDDYGRNILTTVRLPLAEVGRTTARLLVQRIHDTQAAEHVEVLPTELVVRKSTAPPAR